MIDFHAHRIKARDAEIAALKAEVETRRIERDDARETSNLRAARIERMERALAAGPAALRRLAADNLTDYAASLYLQAADDAEAAQAAAMKEET